MEINNFPGLALVTNHASCEEGIWGLEDPGKAINMNKTWGGWSLLKLGSSAAVVG